MKYTHALLLLSIANATHSMESEALKESGDTSQHAASLSEQCDKLMSEQHQLEQRAQEIKLTLAFAQIQAIEKVTEIANGTGHNLYQLCLAQSENQRETQSNFEQLFVMIKQLQTVQQQTMANQQSIWDKLSAIENMIIGLTIRNAENTTQSTHTAPRNHETTTQQTSLPVQSETRGVPLLALMNTWRQENNEHSNQ